MNHNRKHCTNMNHSRTNPPVKFCPTCGDKIKSNSIARCDEDKHRSRRKDRNLFCHDCGISLSS